MRLSMNDTNTPRQKYCVIPSQRNPLQVTQAAHPGEYRWYGMVVNLDLIQRNREGHSQVHDRSGRGTQLRLAQRLRKCRAARRVNSAWDSGDTSERSMPKLCPSIHRTVPFRIWRSAAPLGRR